jgi:hypothetical protein
MRILIAALIIGAVLTVLAPLVSVDTSPDRIGAGNRVAAIEAAVNR